MRSLHTTRVLTIFSLVALCTLSFTVVFGSSNVADTHLHDSPSLFSSFHKRNTPLHHRRDALTATAAAVSTSPQVSQASTAPASTAASSASASASQTTVASTAPSSSSSPAATSSPLSSSSTVKSTSSTPSSGTTTAPLSSSSAPSSSSQFSSSSSSNTPTSSSQGATSSHVGTTSNPTTTPLRGGNVNTNSVTLLTSSGSTLTISATGTSGAISKGFFANKGAVGATFSIIGILAGLAIVMGTLTLLKRYRRRRTAADDEFFEKYSNAGYGSTGGDGSLLEPAGFGLDPLGVSATDIRTTAATSDAYPDRAIHYGEPPSGTVLHPVDYGIAYPPDAAPDNSSPAGGSGGRQEYAYHAGRMQPVPASSAHPFADPANATHTARAPPVRPNPGRAMEMVTTDSYYGPNTAGVGAGSIGYAQ